MDILSSNIGMFGNAGQFIDPLVFGVVFGCVLVMAWIQNGKSSFGLAFAALPSCGRDPFAESGENATFMRRRIDFILREQGFIGLERLSSEDPFVTKLIKQLINSKDAKAFEEWARLQSHVAQKKQTLAATYWSAVSEIAPAIGLIGTIIGLIQLFATGIDPMKMGPAMSFTLLTSLYGMFISHIIAFPIHVRLQARADILNAYRASIVEHLIAIAKRELVILTPVHFSPAKPLRAAS